VGKVADRFHHSKIDYLFAKPFLVFEEIALLLASDSGSRLGESRPFWILAWRRISKRSRDCGWIDALAAITNIATAMAMASASLFPTNRSCPDTSMTPSRNNVPSSLESSSHANPTSTVMPRRFSSGKRSALIPVKASINAVLPWSICPRFRQSEKPCR